MFCENYNWFFSYAASVLGPSYFCVTFDPPSSGPRVLNEPVRNASLDAITNDKDSVAVVTLVCE